MLRNALHDLAKINVAPIRWGRPVRYMIAIGVPAAGGALLHRPSLGVIPALCALLTSQNDLGGSLRHRLIGMAGVVFALVAGGLLGGYTGARHWLPIFALLACGFFVGWMHRTSLIVENVARFCAFGLVVVASLTPRDPILIPMALAGGAWAMLVVAVDFALRRVTPPDLSGSLHKGLARLRAGQTAGWRFAICYAATITVALLLAQEFGATRAGWVAITAILVMRPDGAESLQLVLQRMLGTLVGVVAASVILRVVGDVSILIAVIWVIAFAIPMCLAWHRWLGIAAITALVMVAIDIVLLDQGGARSLLRVRVYDTLLGSVLAVCGTLIASAKVWRGAPPEEAAPE